jgi:hypothetical protein
MTIKFTQQDIDNLQFSDIPKLLLAQQMGLLPEGPQMLLIAKKLRNLAHETAEVTGDNRDPRIQQSLSRIDDLIAKLETVSGEKRGDAIDAAATALDAAKGTRWAAMVVAVASVRLLSIQLDEAHNFTEEEKIKFTESISGLVKGIVMLLNESDGTNRTENEFINDVIRFGHSAKL